MSFVTTVVKLVTSHFNVNLGRKIIIQVLLEFLNRRSKGLFEYLYKFHHPHIEGVYIRNTSIMN
jgi:hypothetical protein